MGLAFSIHREMGRLWGEKIYQSELAYRCQKAGLGKVCTEVPIQVSHREFRKEFFVDLVLNDAMIYELKTLPALTGEQHQQTLNYLLLLGMRHGKLVNMRPVSVESRFVSTRLTPEKRHAFTIDDQYWRELDGDSAWLRQLVQDLVNDWGAFLDTALFFDAIKHYRGGEEQVVKKIEVSDGARILGRQKVHLLNPDVAFNISSMTKDEKHYEQHLRRFIRFTALKATQWINFNHHQITFKTILK